MRKPIIAVVFLLAVMFSSGCAGPNGPSGYEELTSEVHGTITDANGVPLDGVSVSLVSNESTYRDMTGKDGTYNITGVPAGLYRLVVEKKGYDIPSLLPIMTWENNSYERSVVLKPAGSSSRGGMQGTVRDLQNLSLEDVSVFLTGNISSYNCSTDKSGKYNLTWVPAGTYRVVVGKEGYRNFSFNFTILAGYTRTQNFTIDRDCLYYAVNTSANYVLRYGYNGTVYRGYVSYLLDYPEGATYSVYPAADGHLSGLSTVYRAGNRMLSWELDNSAGRYPYVYGYFYMDMNGTQTMQLFNKKEMKISDAAASQHAFLGSETNDEKGRTMINPSNSEIKAIAEQVKGETGSDDTWTVAEAMFAWLKNNTEYYHGPESDKYAQSAIEVLHSRRGDCDELTYLYVSLCRAAGIPARFVGGYLVEKEPKKYAAHVWAEFYDGEWVPVDLAASKNLTYENGVIRGESMNITQLTDTCFGVSMPNHVQTFVDDGTSESIITGNGKGAYYDKRSTFFPNVFYDLTGYDQMYLASCSDGTRELVKEKS